MPDSPGTLVHTAVAGSRPLGADDLWDVPRVGEPAVSPDGRTLAVGVSTWAAGEEAAAARIWLVPTDGGEPRAITAADAVAGGPEFSADGTRIAFSRKPGGDKEAKPQLHVLRLDGGEPERVTDLPLGVEDARWLPDGSGLVIAAKLLRDHLAIDATAAECERRSDDPVKVRATEERVFRVWDHWLVNGEVTHLFHLDLATGECRDLTPDSVAVFNFMEPRGQFDIAPDGREVAYAASVINEDRNEIEGRIFLVALAGGDVECITPDIEGHAMRPRYAPDGATIVYGRTEDRYFYADRPRLYRYERSSGEHVAWCDGWDLAPSQWTFARDATLVLAAESDARTHVYALRPDEHEPRLLAEGGTIGSPCAAADGRVYVNWQTMQQPPEIACVPREGGPLERTTHFTAEALAGVALGEVRELRIEGARGEPVQAFVVLPPDHDGARPAPFVNVIHGGPHGISGDGFHWRWNAHLFAAPGYVVATPNFQGSTSWGTDYARRIQGAWSDRPFHDVMAVADALVDGGLADETRMAAAGGSYGGYLMAWIAGHTDRYRCLVNHAGVYNTLSMFASDLTQGRARAYGSDPWTDIEVLDRTNPARFTAGMTTPMLVIHGENDYRVPVTQGLECYSVLKAKGVPGRLLHFADENHWVLKRHNSVRWYGEVHAWLERWLAPSGKVRGASLETARA